MILTAVLLLGLLSGCNTTKPVEEKAPAAPADIVVKNATETSLTLQWSLSEGASGYEWQIYKSGSVSIEQEGRVNSRNVQISGLEPQTKYQFGVRAIGSNGLNSDYSYADVETTPATDPVEPVDPETPDLSGKYAEFLIPEAEEDGTARAFPGAEGGGMLATGGRGGSVYHVTNLKNSGDGSLRYGIESAGRPLTIVFDVAGLIELESMLNIKKGDLTIAGQTAPGDGICLKNYTFRISASNVIVRFIRCRMGDEKKTEDDAIQVMDHDDDKFSNIIIDHCSVSWCTDECASFYGMKDFSFQWNFVTESLRNSVHGKGSHGYGGIWGGNNASYHHNLLAHHDSRNPRIDHDYVSTQKGPLSIFNNVVYNWSGNTCYGGESSSKNGSDYRKYNFFNNYYKPGPATPSNHLWFLQPTTSCSNCGGTIIPGHFYMAGNYMPGQSAISADNWTAGTKAPVGIYYNAASISQIKSDAPFASDNLQSIHDAEKAFDAVLNYAGASYARDAIDTRIAQETREGKATYSGSNGSKNGLIDTQGDVGGWPEYKATAEQINKNTDTDGDGIPNWFEDQFGLDKYNAADGNANSFDKNGGRYTNLEMYLHWLVKDIIASQTKGSTYTKM